MTGKETIKKILKLTPFNPLHIGDYIRNLHLMKIIRKLPLESFDHVLDAGCGDGHHALNLAKRFPSVLIKGLDISTPFISDIYPPNLSFGTHDLINTLDNQQYDFIYSIDVLEHIPNNIKVIRNFFNAIKIGGYLYIHMPEKLSEKHILSNKFFLDFDKWEQKEHIGERYTLQEIEQQLSKIGFEIIESGHTFGFIGQLAWEIDRLTDNKMILKIFLMPFLKVMAHIAVKISPKYGSIFCLSKKP